MKKIYLIRFLSLVILANLWACENNLDELDLVATGLVLFNDPFDTTVQGNLIDITTSQVDAHGHIWSLTDDPQLSDSNFTNLGPKFQAGVFTSNINELEKSTQYFLRAYARIGERIILGEVVQFTTSELENPVLSSGASNIKENTVSLGGKVNLNSLVYRGEEPRSIIQFIGHVWSTNPDPEINSPFASSQTVITDEVLSGTNDGVFANNLDELLPDTQYYTRAFMELTQRIANSEQRVTRIIYGDQVIIQTRFGN